MRRLLAMVLLACCASFGLAGCLETEVHYEAPANLAITSEGSLTAELVEKTDQGITIILSNASNPNTVTATFTSVKFGDKEYKINQATYDSDPVSIRRGEDKAINLQVPNNDTATITLSSSELSSAEDYSNVDITYSETCMSENGPKTLTGMRITIRNA